MTGHGFDPASYLGDLAPVLPRAEVEDTLERRFFAMPYHGTTIGGEDFPKLDPADSDERGLLIKGEHPEYHEALADPSFEGEIDGVNPRLHLALHELIANQLWDGDPPEAWQAARRLRDGGMHRHDVLHELMAVATEHLHPALVRAAPFDVDAYRRALNALGRGRPTARAEPSHPTYQIKVTLADSDPPIWRRLSLPGDIPLDTLHWVIQAAFGWENDHLHEFEANGRRYADHGYRAVPGTEDERRATLAAAAPRKGDRLRYTYDFGDNWVHDIAVESVEPAEDDPRVVCLAAENAGPPEDCGGIPGYYNLLEAITNPRHPEHDNYLDWLGEEPLDPTAVDRDAINRALESIKV
ncbi:MAG TPA: DUF1841 family protein [Actinophytocola sp.]|uniref:DUF1841 family protein n=1 Tax=Actinophytocola sp. TaxID=1872138 RepID=UPI002DDD206B|nr:DUF1841 family protein [Actinophytocola sp.]HEV2780802.1 DUF1841 family protein [Actinophytocola sp.]